MKDGEIIFVDSLTMSETKTKNAEAVMKICQRLKVSKYSRMPKSRKS